MTRPEDPSALQGGRSVPPTGIAVADWIAHHATTTPDVIATRCIASGRARTYGQMHDRVGRVAAVLRELGVVPGDRVAFLALNTPDILDIVCGCWRIGAVCLALNFRLTGPELAYILDDAAPRVVFVEDGFRAVTDPIAGRTPVAHWIGFDGLGGDSDLERAIASAVPLNSGVVRDLSDQALLLYSSGTTGRPKGVVITHAQLHFSFGGGPDLVGARRGDVTLSAMPMFHIGALNVSCLPALRFGATVAILRSFDPVAALRAIGDPDLGITTIFFVPSAYNAMRMVPEAETTDFSRVRVALAGAEVVPVGLMRWWAARGIAVQEGWGMTETAGSGCVLLPEFVGDKLGSAGKAFMGNPIRIADVATGAELGPDQCGEIQMRGPTVTPGYWNRADATAEAFSADGWFRTGDIGRMDADGFIYIEDRLKDMYISGGENVYPAEVEDTLFGADNLAEVAVIGVPDTRWGEVGCACVVARDAARPVTLAALHAACDGQLARYKWPAHVVTLDEIPRNATGKALKFELRRLIPEKLG